MANDVTALSRVRPQRRTILLRYAAGANEKPERVGRRTDKAKPRGSGHDGPRGQVDANIALIDVYMQAISLDILIDAVATGNRQYDGDRTGRAARLA